MKKLKNSCMVALLAALLSMLSVGSYAQTTTVILSYCNDEITANDFRTSLEYDSPIQAAVCFPAAKLVALKGGKITKIRIGAEEGMTKTYCWVRPSLDKGAITIQRLGTTTDGWNEVTLSNPYTITGDEIYVGYNCTLPAGKSVILNGTTNTNGGWLYAEGTGWNDMSAQNKGSLLIQAVVEIDGTVDTEDLGMESLTTDSRFVKNGTEYSFVATVANYGKEDKPMPTLHYQIGTMQEQTIEVSETVKAGANIQKTFSATVDGLPEGKNTMKVWFDNSDAVVDNNSISKDLYVYTKSYPRTMLLEHFTGLSCVNCPIGDKALHNATESRNDVAWVSHHVGYEEDELTVDASRDITGYGATSAPLAMVDRTVNPISDNNKPTFGINWGTVNTSTTVVDAVLKYSAIQPSFVSVNIDNSYDEATRTLSTTVSGERNGTIYNLVYDLANLTIYLTEDKVVTNVSQKGGEPSDTIQAHVLRTAMTGSYGDQLAWDGDTYSATYTTTLPDNWKAEDMKVVAFVNRPIINNDYTNTEVLNTAIKSLTETTGIHGINSTTNGSLHYFNLQGQQVMPSMMQAGNIYIEVSTFNGKKTVKKIKK